MKTAFWLIIVVALGTLVFGVRHLLRKLRERERAEEARAAEFMAMVAVTKPAAPPSVAPAVNDLGPQKLLFEAAHKAGEAGEHALAIQLYARLLARFPSTAFAEQAREAVVEQKKRLSRTPST